MEKQYATQSDAIASVIVPTILSWGEIGTAEHIAESYDLEAAGAELFEESDEGYSIRSFAPEPSGDDREGSDAYAIARQEFIRESIEAHRIAS